MASRLSWQCTQCGSYNEVDPELKGFGCWKCGWTLSACRKCGEPAAARDPLAALLIQIEAGLARRTAEERALLADLAKIPSCREVAAGLGTALDAIEERHRRFELDATDMLNVLDELARTREQAAKLLPMLEPAPKGAADAPQ